MKEMTKALGMSIMHLQDHRRISEDAPHCNMLLQLDLYMRPTEVYGVGSQCVSIQGRENLMALADNIIRFIKRWEADDAATVQDAKDKSDGHTYPRREG